MRVVIFGATGMLGSGALIECLDDPRVQSVLAITRKPTGVRHPKFREIVHDDFFDYSSLAGEFRACDACFFCLGVTSVGLDEATYTRLTHDLTLTAARALYAANPAMTFAYLSGTGTDSSEQGRIMWARVKGRTENALLNVGFRGAYMLRPGYVQPFKGVRSSTHWYQAVYTIFGFGYPLFQRIAPGLVTSTDRLGQALLHVAANGYPKHVLEVRDINRAAVAAA